MAVVVSKLILNNVNNPNNNINSRDFYLFRQEKYGQARKYENKYSE